MSKRLFRPGQSEDPRYPTSEQVEGDRRAFLQRCGASTAGLCVLALTGTDTPEAMGGKKKPRKKPSKKRKGRKRPPTPPVPGGPRHPPAPIERVPTKKKDKKKKK